MTIPDHHKYLAKHLREKFGEPSSVIVYRDNDGNRPVPIGKFGRGKRTFYSTIGLCDKSMQIPEGCFEFAAMGGLEWLPNAIVSSVYWLKIRTVEEWPIVCEDVVRQNVKSTYRHMAYVPSEYLLQVPSGPEVRWLLGVPIKDSELPYVSDEASQKCMKLYPSWLLEGRA